MLVLNDRSVWNTHTSIISQLFYVLLSLIYNRCYLIIGRSPVNMKYLQYMWDMLSFIRAKWFHSWKSIILSYIVLCKPHCYDLQVSLSDWLISTHVTMNFSECNALARSSGSPLGCVMIEPFPTLVQLITYLYQNGGSECWESFNLDYKIPS